jgi:ribulose 1,5-bisphosphate carboxylase large subunit-like protein
VAATRQAVSAWIEAIKLQDHPERNALLKRSLAEAV